MSFASAAEARAETPAERAGSRRTAVPSPSSLHEEGASWGTASSRSRTSPPCKTAYWSSVLTVIQERHEKSPKNGHVRSGLPRGGTHPGRQENQFVVGGQRRSHHGAHNRHPTRSGNGTKPPIVSIPRTQETRERAHIATRGFYLEEEDDLRSATPREKIKFIHKIYVQDLTIEQ